MKTFYTSGTVGDAYIILCKLYNITEKEQILCKHYTKHTAVQPIIEEIYSLVPNISTEFMRFKASEVTVRGNFIYFDQEREQSKYGYDIEFFPKFDLPDTNFNLPDSYTVVQTSAGTESTRRRKVDKANINNIIGGNNVVVLLGHNDGVTIDTSNVTDLRDKTTIGEAINIIAKSDSFYGYQGFLSFVALSQQVPSTVFIKSVSDRVAVASRIPKPWKEYCTKKTIR